MGLGWFDGDFYYLSGLAFVQIYFGLLGFLMKEGTRPLAYLPLFLILVGLAAYFFSGLGLSALHDFDEAQYAEISRNIVKSGEWISLRWGSEFPWIDKPPLYFWLTALAFKTFGVSEFSARFWSAVFGLGTVILTFYAARNWTQNKYIGLLAAIILLASKQFVFQAGFGTLDVAVTFFVLLTLYSGDLGIRQDGRYLWLAGLSLALGALTKSVVGLLPLAILIPWLFINRSKLAHHFRLGLLGGVLIFLVLFLPWHLFMYARYGNYFIEQYIGVFLWQRFSANVGHPAGRFWYVRVFFEEYQPWFYLLPLSFIFNFRQVLAEKKWRLLLPLLWFLIVFGIFSWSYDKLRWYMTIFYPFLAILLAGYLWQLLRQPLNFTLQALAVLFLLLLSLQRLDLRIALLMASSVSVIALVIDFWLMQMRKGYTFLTAQKWMRALGGLTFLGLAYFIFMNIQSHPRPDCRNNDLRLALSSLSRIEGEKRLIILDLPFQGYIYYGGLGDAKLMSLKELVDLLPALSEKIFVAVREKDYDQIMAHEQASTFEKISQSNDVYLLEKIW